MPHRAVGSLVMGGLAAVMWLAASPAAAADLRDGASGDDVGDTARQTLDADMVEEDTEPVAPAADATTTLEPTTAAAEARVRDTVDAVSKAAEDTTDTVTEAVEDTTDTVSEAVADTADGGTEPEQQPTPEPPDAVGDGARTPTGDRDDDRSAGEQPTDPSGEPGARDADGQPGTAVPSPPPAEYPGDVHPDAGVPMSGADPGVGADPVDGDRLAAALPGSTAAASDRLTAPVRARLPAAEHGGGEPVKPPSGDDTPPDGTSGDPLPVAAPPVAPPAGGLGSLLWLVAAAAAAVALAGASLVHVRGARPAALPVLPAAAGLRGGAGGGSPRAGAGALAGVDALLRRAYRWSQARPGAPYDSLGAQTRAVVAAVTFWLWLALGGDGRRGARRRWRPTLGVSAMRACRRWVHLRPGRR